MPRFSYVQSRERKRSEAVIQRGRDRDGGRGGSSVQVFVSQAVPCHFAAQLQAQISVFVFPVSLALDFTYPPSFVR